MGLRLTKVNDHRPCYSNMQIALFCRKENNFVRKLIQKAACRVNVQMCLQCKKKPSSVVTNDGSSYERKY